jgi:hypothetical protein
MNSQISQFDADVLNELESSLNKNFTLVNEIKWDTEMGFTVKNQMVNGIGLYQSNLTNLPESITRLKSLEKLYLRQNRLSNLP